MLGTITEIIFSTFKMCNIEIVRFEEVEDASGIAEIVTITHTTIVEVMSKRRNWPN